MNFLRQTAIRLGYAIALLLAVVVLNFVLIHIAPGDIADRDTVLTSLKVLAIAQILFALAALLVALMIAPDALI